MNQVNTTQIDRLIDQIIQQIPQTHASIRVKQNLFELQSDLIAWQAKLHDLNNDPAMQTNE